MARAIRLDKSQTQPIKFSEITLPHFTSDGYTIAYEIYGEGAPIVLVHGFASNGVVNWLDTGWVEELTGQGYQVITIDNRGHGQSEKVMDKSAYDAKLMARDTIHLIDHLNLGKVALMGYSMGSRISAFVTRDAPEKVSALIIGGMGSAILKFRGRSEEIEAALRAPSLDDVVGDTGRQFRRFAEHTKSDLDALAACITGPSTGFDVSDFENMELPVLIAVGSDDDVAGSGADLAKLIPKGEYFEILRRDHMRATGDPTYKKAVRDFLSRHY